MPLIQFYNNNCNNNSIQTYKFSSAFFFVLCYYTRKYFKQHWLSIFFVVQLYIIYALDFWFAYVKSIIYSLFLCDYIYSLYVLRNSPYFQIFPFFIIFNVMRWIINIPTLKLNIFFIFLLYYNFLEFTCFFSNHHFRLNDWMWLY